MADIFFWINSIFGINFLKFSAVVRETQRKSVLINDKFTLGNHDAENYRLSSVEDTSFVSGSGSTCLE
jgi:hypothetical protein